MTETDPKKFAKDHENYRDIWDRGLENYPFVRPRIVPLIYEVPDGAKVLDIGCNSGEFIKHLKEKKGCDVYGIDISQQLVDKCHEKGLDKVYCCDADHLPFKDGEFDVVTLMETLEHFDDPVVCLKEIRRVLKKNGYLLGTCPHANLERYAWDDERLHKQYYDEERLKKDLETSFRKNYIKTLTGGQFNMAFASSYLASVPCQILFKSGGKHTQDWDEVSQKTDKLRVYWAFTQLAGVIYYRMRGFSDKMDKMGIESAYEMFEYDLRENQAKWQERLNNKFVTDDLNALLSVADISVWQIFSSRFGIPLLMAAKDLFKKPIVTEVDDWLFDLPSYNIASNPFRNNSDPEWMAYRQLELSDAIITSTPYLKEHLLEFFPDKTIYVIPNSIDFELWDNLKESKENFYPKEEGKIRIGFTGCSNHNGDLELISRPLKKILEDFPNVEFICYHQFDAIKNFPRMINTNKWVPINIFPGEIRRWDMDIGIAPLRDNNFNRSKSNLRWLEYSALKIPTVASNVQPFKSSITDGKNGILCKGSDLEWYEALKDLIVSEGKRKAIGEEAYKEVKEKFNMDTIAKKYSDVLKEIQQCNAQKSKKNVEDCSTIPTMTDGQLVTSGIG